MERLQGGSAPERTLSGLVLDNIWFGVFVCLVTLFGYLVWAIIEIQNHYYFITVPFGPGGGAVP
ncbi:MAG: hypothetical protein HY331_01210 [Chloroflexi bacterium]|nr:hypothetical protein [Chloroflexota bacterium]